MKLKNIKQNIICPLGKTSQIKKDRSQFFRQSQSLSINLSDKSLPIHKGLSFQLNRYDFCDTVYSFDLWALNKKDEWERQLEKRKQRPSYGLHIQTKLQLKCREIRKKKYCQPQTGELKSATKLKNRLIKFNQECKKLL